VDDNAEVKLSSGQFFPFKPNKVGDITNLADDISDGICNGLVGGVKCSFFIVCIYNI
jgi:hypothetical protein